MPTTEKKPFEVFINFSVQTYDIDFAGVVSNIVYIRWLEDLRLAILENYYPLERFLEAGVAPTLIQTNIRYLRPVTIWDKPVGHMWIDRMRRLKFGFKAEITVDGEAAITAEQVGCLINMAENKAVPMPDELYDGFHEFQKRN